MTTVFFAILYAMVLRVVIDSNRLQSEELRVFLSVHVNNFAVLTDYAWMEAYKGNSIVSIQKSMAILKDFPEQVIVLKGTKAVSSLDPRAPGIAQRMQWSRGGRDFHDTVKGLEQAAAGHPGTLAKIIEHGRSADHQMERLLADAMHLPAAFAGMMETIFTQGEIAAIRAGKPHTLALIEKFFDIVDYVAGRFYRAHPLKPRPPSRRSRYDSFMYRFSMAALLYLLNWIKEGGQLNKAPNKVLNDLVDINFATYGTYFNGVMSGDKRVINLYTELTVVLRAVKVRVPEEYYQNFIEQLEAMPING